MTRVEAFNELVRDYGDVGADVIGPIAVTERIARREAEGLAEDYRIGQDTLRARVRELEAQVKHLQVELNRRP